MTDIYDYSRTVDFSCFDTLDDLITKTDQYDIAHFFDGDYSELLNEIDEWISPKASASFNMDYESMRLLLDQSKNMNLSLYSSLEKRARFIICNSNKNVTEKILIDEGYLKPWIVSSLIDPHLYRNVYNCLSNNNDMGEVDEERKKVIAGFLNDTELWNNPTNIYKHMYSYVYMYRFNSSSREYDEFSIEESTKLFALDLLADYLFQDYYLNVWNDMTQILKYVRLTGETAISQENLSFYQVFVALKDANIETIRAFFNQNKETNKTEAFYEDIRLLKDKSYQSLIDHCTNFNKESPLYNKELSDTYGCDVYYLNGEPFNSFARTSERIRKGRYKLSEDKSDIPELTKEDINRTGFSFTYLNGNDIQTYHDPKEFVTILYKGIKKEHIGHVYKNDSESDPNYYYYSDKINELHTPESLTAESILYPEILVTNPEDAIPVALFCLDKITEWDVAFSKKFGLPIVLANSLKYARKYDKEDFRDNNYVR